MRDFAGRIDLPLWDWVAKAEWTHRLHQERLLTTRKDHLIDSPQHHCKSLRASLRPLCENLLKKNVNLNPQSKLNKEENREMFERTNPFREVFERTNTFWGHP
jgi:hypothetical protein